MVETLLDRTALWLMDEGPEAPVVVATETSLLRNLADFSFPAQSSREESNIIEERVMRVLESTNLLTNGEYFPLSASGVLVDKEDPSLDVERYWTERILAERKLLAYYEPAVSKAQDTIRLIAPHGVYVADDQSMSIMVNGADHLCIRVLASGFQSLETWARLNMIDDTLTGALGAAFDERYGYLISDLGHVGTGLATNVVLHLPALATLSKIEEVAQLALQSRQVLHGLKPMSSFPVEHISNRSQTAEKAGEQVRYDALCGDWYGTLTGTVNESAGDLFSLSNVVTLGVSEEEILFHQKHLVNEIIERENEARNTLKHSKRIHLEDRVARAISLAQSVRLLGFSEALALLSSIRLGVSTGLLEGISIAALNEWVIASQNFHVWMKSGHNGDGTAVSKKRAAMFRTHFSAH